MTTLSRTPCTLRRTWKRWRTERRGSGRQEDGSPRAADRLRDRRSLLWFSLAGLTVLSAAIMLVDLGRKPLWRDEAFTGYVAIRSTSTMFAILAKREGNMPLYYVMEHVWSSVGTSPLWLRLPSALAAVATIPVTVLIGRRIFGDQVALTAGLLLTLNGFLVHYGRRRGRTD